MRELADLINYVNPKRLNRLSYFFRSSAKRRKTHVGRLYEAVVNKKIGTDKEGSKLLFGYAGSSHYYKVKHELKQQLLNSVLLVESDQKDKGTYYEVFIHCRKELYAAEVLFVEGHIEASIYILKKLLSKAIEAELTEIVLPVLYYLRTYSLTVVSDVEACIRYRALEKYWIRIRDAEERVDHMYAELAVNYVGTSAPPKESVYLAKEFLVEVEEKFKDIKTARYLHRYFFIRSVLHDSLGEHREGIEVGWEAVEELGKIKLAPRGFMRSVLFHIIASSIRLRALHDGRRAVLKALTLVDEGTRPWFRINQLYLYLCVRSDDFGTAVRTMNKMIGHKWFKKLPVGFKERCYLLRAYLNWLIAIGKADTGNERLDSFRIGRFINNVPEFSKDKLGMNVPILIIQALWLLQQRRYLLARHRLDNLKRYALKYLASSKGVLRTYYFIRTLTQLSNANFHRGAFIRKSAPHYRSLQEQPVTENLQSVEVEIIPYEDLYQYTLDLLDDSVH